MRAACFSLLLALAASAQEGRPPVDELTRLLDAESQRADEAFARRDCTASIAGYQTALDLARRAGAGARVAGYHRRLGICRARIGELERALESYTAGIAASEATSDLEMLAENVHGAGLTLQKLGRIAEAYAQAERQQKLTEQCGHAQHQARALWLLAESYDRMGKARPALQMYERALELARASKDTNGTLILMDALANRYATLGDIDTAVRYEREVIASTSPSDHASLAAGYTNLGEMQLNVNRVAPAKEAFVTALRLSTAPDAWRARLAVLVNLSRVHRRQREFAEAMKLLDEALAIGQKSKSPEQESVVRQAMAETLLDQGRLTESAAAAESAIRICRAIAAPHCLHEPLATLGQIHDAASHPAEAQAAYEEAIATIEYLRESAPGDVGMLRHSFQKVLPVYQRLVANLVRRGDADAALRWTEQAKARGLMDILRNGGVDERKGMSPDERAQDARLRAQLSSAQQASSRNSSPQAKRKALDAAAELERFRARIAVLHPEHAIQTVSFDPVPAARLVSLLPNPRTAMLEYFFVPGGLELFVVRVTNGTPRIFAIHLDDPGQTIETEVRQFRQQLAQRDLGYRDTATRLYQRLLAPAESQLRAAPDWIISPDGGLWELPFQALIDSGGRHVAETHVVSLTPSLTALWEIRHRRRPANQPLQLLALANPALPDAEREVAEIRKLYPSGNSLTLAGAHTQDRFRERAPEARVIHIATHAELNDVNPLFSSLSIDGMLTAREIMNMRLHAALVVLSACETGLGESGKGEGLLGLGWALSSAGADASILSYWKVDSSSTADFMIALHRNLNGARAANHKPAALRRAALETMKSPSYSHPFYWAAFMLLGDGN